MHDSELHDSPINQPDPPRPGEENRKPTLGDRICFAGFIAFVIVSLGLMLLAGCSSTSAIPGVTKAENALTTAESSQSSKASASVGAATVANQSNPDGNPKVAVAGELGVATANLPVATPSDANAALARVNQALTGQLSAAQTGWNSAIAEANTAKAQIATLETQVTAEKAAAAQAAKDAVAAQREAEVKVWQTRMMGVGLALFLAAAGLVAAGVFIGIPKLYQVAIVPAAFAAIALFAAYEAGTPQFAILAFITIAGTVASLAYGAYTLYSEGGAVKTKAGAFKSLVNVVDGVADDAKAGIETTAKSLWAKLDKELSEAEQWLVSKTAKPTTPPIAAPVAPATIAVTPPSAMVGGTPISLPQMSTLQALSAAQAAATYPPPSPPPFTNQAQINTPASPATP